MNKSVDREQIDSYNELEQMLKERCISDDMADALRMFAQAAVDTAGTSLKRLADLCSTEIAILEQRKKHCKNYLELKQINRSLNILKFKQNKRR
jgi:hypothetical protein